MSLFSALLSSSAAGQGLDSLISPGPLSRAHAELAGLQNCASCHTAGRGVEAQKCLSCHRDLEERIRNGAGFHRDKSSDCVRCHAEHHGNEMLLVRFDPHALDHRETGYPLLGEHLEIEACVKCHRADRAPARKWTTSYLLRDARCVACHEDPHRGELGEDCLRCHPMERKFQNAQFDHDEAAFPLRGAHQRVACRSCHRGTSFEVLRFSRCQDCHEDAHRPSLGGDCERCHQESSWSALAPGFDHEGTAFPLRGMHRTVDCARCHPGNRFKNLSFARCDDCHEPDPHLGQFGERDCSRCHGVEGFRETSFDHERSSFPLTGKHATVICARCHPQQDGEFPAGRGIAVRFVPTVTSCFSCHADVHLGQLDQRCDACHTTSGFDRKTLLFDHQRGSRFPLRGRHATLDCGQCHRIDGSGHGEGAAAVRYRPMSLRCAACHPNPHDPSGRGVSEGPSRAECERCHTVDGFVRDGFDHERTKFPLRGKHASLTCDRCHRFLPHENHPVLTFRELESGCADCHRTPHSARQNDCQACHGANDWSVRAW